MATNPYVISVFASIAAWLERVPSDRYSYHVPHPGTGEKAYPQSLSSVGIEFTGCVKRNGNAARTRALHGRANMK